MSKIRCNFSSTNISWIAFFSGISIFSVRSTRSIVTLPIFHYSPKNDFPHVLTSGKLHSAPIRDAIDHLRLLDRVNADKTGFYFPGTDLFQSTGLISVIGKVVDNECKIKKEEKPTEKVIDRTYAPTRANARELLASHSR